LQACAENTTARYSYAEANDTWPTGVDG